jgi:DNA helicase-2/ATP-dependent DNA helicase PcrA
VGLTRAKERLFLSHASERRLLGRHARAGGARRCSCLSCRRQLLQGDVPRSGGVGDPALRVGSSGSHPGWIDPTASEATLPSQCGVDGACRARCPGRWAGGRSPAASSFGEGHVTHLFGSGEKISIAVKFEGMGPKILDPRLAPIEPL